jgi:hypothetical protein
MASTKGVLKRRRVADDIQEDVMLTMVFPIDLKTGKQSEAERITGP